MWVTLQSAVGRRYELVLLFCIKDIMGGCCSGCCGDGKSDDDGNKTTLSTAEIELQAQQAEKDLKSLCVARGMSAPTIEVIDRVQVRFRSYVYIIYYFIVWYHCSSDSHSGSMSLLGF
jgi:hypothetical protein